MKRDSLSRSSPRGRIAGAVGVVAVLLFLCMVSRFWHPVYGFTAFLQLDSSNDGNKIAAFRELPVFVYRDTGGYDGLFYAQIAYDLSLASPELAPAMDSLGYRGRRIFGPVLAWALAFGNPKWIVHVYSVLNVAAWLALAALLWRMLPVRDLRGWIAWAGVLFSAGALSSVRLALPDLVALSILAGAMFLLERRLVGGALGTLAVAGLTRETSLIAIPGFWERPWLSWRNVLRTIAAAAPLVAWMAYVRWRVGPGGTGMRNFDWPLFGWIGKWAPTFAALTDEGDHLLAWATLLAALALTAQAAYIFLHRGLDDRWWRAGAAYAALFLFLGPAVWEGFPGAATRVLLPLTLAFNVFASRNRASLAWLLAGNLSVAAGLVAVKDVPRDPTELAAGRSGEAACVAREGTGWHGVEREKNHRWAWSRSTATAVIEAWPKTDAAVRVEFALRSLSPRKIAIRCDGRELWTGTVGGDLTAKRSILVPLHHGGATLELATDEPAVPEGPAANARLLAFALYDLRFVAP